MNVSVGLRGDDAFICCDVCGYEWAVPDGVTARTVMNEFLRLHPATDHDLVEAPHWEPGGVAALLTAMLGRIVRLSRRT